MIGALDPARLLLAPPSDGAPGGSSDGSGGGTDHEIARALAEEAGHLLLDLRRAMASEAATEREIKDAGDLESHQFLMEALRRLRPGDRCRRPPRRRPDARHRRPADRAPGHRGAPDPPGGEPQPPAGVVDGR